MHGKDSQPFCNNLAIMLTLCLMLSDTYYAKNCTCAGIISLGLHGFMYIYIIITITF